MLLGALYGGVELVTLLATADYHALLPFLNTLDQVQGYIALFGQEQQFFYTLTHSSLFSNTAPLLSFSILKCNYTKYANG